MANNSTYFSSEKGKLYLIPTTLGEGAVWEVLPMVVKKKIEEIDFYIAENEKTARHFIKKLVPSKNQSLLNFNVLNKFTKEEEIPKFLAPCEAGINVGLLSEAGCPGVADPGAQVVSIAHEKKIKVIPLVGPSSILLALMASGLNGQSFTFNGYLPIDKNERKKQIRDLERISLERNQAQIFIETPYRNEQLLEDLINYLNPNTRISIARELTLPTEFILTKTVSEWKNIKVDLHKKPTIFIFQREF